MPAPIINVAPIIAAEAAILANQNAHQASLSQIELQQTNSDIDTPSNDNSDGWRLIGGFSVIFGLAFIIAYILFHLTDP